MDTFATVDDLEKRYKTLSPSEKQRAEILLEDAAALLRSEFARYCKAIDEGDELLMINLKVVSCAMVKRIIANGIEADVKQTSITAGSFSEQMTFNNPAGDLYLRDQERRMLGIPKSKVRMGFVMPGSRGEGVCNEG